MRGSAGRAPAAGTAGPGRRSRHRAGPSASGRRARQWQVRSSRSSVTRLGACRRSPEPTSSAATRSPVHVSHATSPSRMSRPGPRRARSNDEARSQSPTASWSTRAVASWRTATRPRRSNSSASSSSSRATYANSALASGRRGRLGHPQRFGPDSPAVSHRYDTLSPSRRSIRPSKAALPVYALRRPLGARPRRWYCRLPPRP